MLLLMDLKQNGPAFEANEHWYIFSFFFFPKACSNKKSEDEAGGRPGVFQREAVHLSWVI